MNELIGVRLRLGDVDYARLETDEDYQEVAWEKMPEALSQIGVIFGEKAWDTFQKTFSVGFVKMNISKTNRDQFVKSAAQMFLDQNLENTIIREEIIRQLRENKTKLEAGEKID